MTVPVGSSENVEPLVVTVGKAEKLDADTVPVGSSEGDTVIVLVGISVKEDVVMLKNEVVG